MRVRIQKCCKLVQASQLVIVHCLRDLPPPLDLLLVPALRDLRLTDLSPLDLVLPFADFLLLVEAFFKLL